MNAPWLAALGSVVACCCGAAWGGAQLAAGAEAAAVVALVTGALYVIHAGLAAVLMPAAGLGNGLVASLPAAGVLALGPLPALTIAWLVGAAGLLQLLAAVVALFLLAIALIAVGHGLRVLRSRGLADLGAVLVSGAALLLLGQAAGFAG